MRAFFCNRYKGSDIASISQAGNLVRLYNPRTDDWAQHFELAPDQITILSTGEIGEVTVRLLELNLADRLLERQTLHAIGRYPPTAVMQKIRARP
jgi:hypothetical protein